LLLCSEGEESKTLINLKQFNSSLHAAEFSTSSGVSAVKYAANFSGRCAAVLVREREWLKMTAMKTQDKLLL
jgi:hypothetical protein